jgi:hypothetical protein
MAKPAAKKSAPAKAVPIKKAVPAATKPVERTRSYLSQEDVPAYGLNDALLIPNAMFTQYGGGPSTPLDVAAALDMLPSSSKFRMLCGASIAFGLTTGGYNAPTIAATDIARRIIKPTEEGDDLAARREAVLKPRIIREFLSKYSGSQLPREDIGRNVLAQMRVPDDRTEAVLEMILQTAAGVGFIRTIKDKKYADLVGVKPPPVDEMPGEEGAEQPPSSIERAKLIPEPFNSPQAESPAAEVKNAIPPSVTQDSRMRKVFITHGKNTSFIEPIKELLGFGELIPVVSVEKQSVAQPVPDKVMSDMRGCGAAIIHVRDGIKLPSNLQGLYEVRYQGDTLDGLTTIKLIKAINEMKSTPLPSAE